MKRSIGVLGVLTLGLGLALAAPTAASAAPLNGTIHVPDDFVPAASDTRANGHYEVQGTGLRIWTDGSADVIGTVNQDKVAEYVATTTPLATIGGPTLEYTTNSGSIPPGYQLVVDFDGNGSSDGILVGEPSAYGNDWWATDGSADFVKLAAPSNAGGSGSLNHGTLADWRIAFPDAVVTAFGFSLGSGVEGDYVLRAINFAGTHYLFAQHVTLASKDECKNGRWAASTKPVFRNQGECVSSFASAKRAAAFSL